MVGGSGKRTVINLGAIPKVPVVYLRAITCYNNSYKLTSFISPKWATVSLEVTFLGKSDNQTGTRFGGSKVAKKIHQLIITVPVPVAQDLGR